jgi:hypothetical protein
MSAGISIAFIGSPACLLTQAIVKVPVAIFVAPRVMVHA